MAECETTRHALLGLNASQVAGLREWKRIEELHGPIADFDLVELDSAAERRMPKGVRRILAEGGLVERGRREQDAAHARGLTIVVAGDELYPSRLSRLANPPLALFVRGQLPSSESPAVGIVGSRRCTRYGIRTAETFGRELARRGVGVVSGLARGIDAAAHRGACAAPGFSGIAVLGCGLDRVYPSEHSELADELAQCGALVSEFGVGVAPLARNFPRRNRILAALSDGLLVVEAQLKSGALITTRWASELGIEVLVAPNQSDNPAAAGSLQLLREGARLVRDVDDLIEDLELDLDPVDSTTGGDSVVNAAKPGVAGARGLGSTGSHRPSARIEAADRRLLESLDHEPVPVDQILGGLGMSAGEALSRLMKLELAGEVEQTPGLCFRRVSGRGTTP